MATYRELAARGRGGRLVAALLLLILVGNPAPAGFSLFLNPADPATLDANWYAGGWGDDWVPYVLGVASDDGTRIGAVDVDLRGVFHQRWNWSEETQDFTASPRGLNLGGSDSQLLMPENALLPVAPFEDNNSSSANLSLPNVPGKFNYGVGSQLKGVWGFPGASATSQNLAYLVMPRGYESQLEYAIDVASPTGDLFRFRQGASFPALPPEPPVVVPETLPKHLNPLPSVVMPTPAGTPPTSPQPPVSQEVLPTPPTTSGSNLFPWIAELDSSNDPTLPYGYKAYKFGVSTNDGSSIAAVDIRIGHGLLQVVKDLDDDGILDPTIRGTATTGADSHFLIPDGSVVMPLSEQLFGDPVRNDPSLFQSSSMGGAWGFPKELQSDTADLAYVVVDASMDIRRIGMHVEVATRNGDTFLPTSYLMAKHFAVLDANGTVIRPALVDVPPIVEQPVVPNEPPVVIDQPGPENPEGIPEVVGQDPPVETPFDPIQDPTIIEEVAWTPIVPFRLIVWEPGIFVPAIDWQIYLDPTDTDVAISTSLIDNIDFITQTDSDSDSTPRKFLTSLTLKSFMANAALASNVTLYAYDGGLGSAAASAPEPSGVILAVVATLGVARLGRRRGDG